MDIAIVVANYDRAEGTGGYTVELVSRLAREHRVTLYAAGLQAEPPDGVRVIRVPALRSRGYPTILTFPAAFAMVRQRHDIVHAQGWSAASADVVTAHIVLGAWRHAARAAGIWPGAGERLLGPFVESQERKLMRRARAVIAPSERAKQDLADAYQRSAHVTVVRHGFSLTRTSPDRAAARRRFAISPDAFLALYAGDPRKGLGAALEAVAACPGTSLLVAGHADYASFRARAEFLSIAPRVHWAGPLSGLAEAFAASDVLLHPTIYDSFGLVIAEAMAAGLPVAVSRTAGVSELMRDRESGWLLLDASGTAATAALRALQADASLRARLAAGARAVAATRSWDDVVRETERVYETLR